MDKREEEALWYYKRSKFYGSTDKKALRFVQDFIPYKTTKEIKGIIVKYVKKQEEAERKKWNHYKKQEKKWRKAGNGLQ